METRADEPNADLELALIDRELDGRTLVMSFPKALEAQFEEETGRARSRLMVLQGLGALALYNTMLVLDYFAIPETFWLAVLIRSGLVSGFALLTFAVMWRNPVAWVRECLAGLTSALACFGGYVLVATSSSPLRSDYHFGMIFVVMFLITVQKLRFWFAVPTLLAITVIFAVTALSVDTISQASQLSAIALMVGMTAFALAAGYGIEREERRAWLRSVRDRLRASVFEELAAIDPMTGLGNRRAMRQWIEAQTRNANAGSISVIVADIDFFKSYNDAFGHLQGDECIRRVAGFLVSEARGPHDRAFRFGGEEFVVVLVGQDLESGCAIAERMRRAIARARIPHRSSTGRPFVTCSFGVGSATLTPELDISELIGAADKALYSAKRGGRNTVVPPILELAAGGRAG